jgi:putative transposase
MPRTARASAGDVAYHVINRGNGRMRVFHRAADYAAFLRLLADANERFFRETRGSMRILGYCLMPSHFHLVLWPRRDGDLSRWMQWLLTAHVRRYHRLRGTSGHVWQGRFKAFPIQQDDHLLTVLRYVERNPLRARLVKRAELWPWSSLAATHGAGREPARSLQGSPSAGPERGALSNAPARKKRAGGTRAQMPPAERPVPGAELLHVGPVDRPANWLERVNTAETDQELEQLRRCLERGTPLGSPGWVASTARRLGIESSLRSRGRPRLVEK